MSMKGIRVIPAFILLILLSYLGMIFVEQNRQMVVIAFGKWHSESIALGFVVLTSILVGMVLCGTLCTIEMLTLYIQNKSLRRRLSLYVGRATVAKNNGKRDAKVATGELARPENIPETHIKD